MAVINNKKFQDDMKTYEDNFFNTIFTDAPYQLGTEWYIDKIDGRPKVKGNSKDFMNKWDGLNEDDLDLFFKESHRVVKYGGYLLIFGMDRQLLPLEYYARLNGFEQCQSLYWYFISNFPKSADLSKNIDKKLFNDWIKKQDICNTKKQELKSKEFKKWLKEFRESLDNPFNRDIVSNKIKKAGDMSSGNYGKGGNYEDIKINITQSNTELGQQFEGHKYGIAPTKQTNEVLLCFKKEYTFTQRTAILITDEILLLLKCITTKIQKKEKVFGTYVSNVEKTFICHQVEKYLKNGNLIVPIDADLIEKLNANSVENISILNLQKNLNIVLKNAIQILCEVLKETNILNGLVGDIKEKMDIFLLEIQKTYLNLNLNIELLYLIILAENLNLMKMSTISMEKEMITELKILNYYHMENIQSFTILKNSKKEKLQKSNVDIVVRNFINITAKLSILKEIFAVKNTGINFCEEKQCNETILVFRKAPKESIISDIINKDDNCSPCCLNIDGCRVKTNENLNGGCYSGNERNDGNWKDNTGFKNNNKNIKYIATEGRFPPQTFLSKLTAEIIDNQSGIITSGSRKSEYIKNRCNPNETYGKFNSINMDNCEKQEFGASRICHICDYEKGDYDLYNYNTKVSEQERNFGLDEFENKEFKSDVPIPQRKNRPFNEVKNTHPTLKPINLIKQIANYFKLPSECNQKVYIPFCGTLSEVIGFRLAGYNSENIYGCELNKEYVDIGLARFKAYEDMAIKEKKETKRIEDNNLLKWQ